MSPPARRVRITSEETIYSWQRNQQAKVDQAGVFTHRYCKVAASLSIRPELHSIWSLRFEEVSHSDICSFPVSHDRNPHVLTSLLTLVSIIIGNVPHVVGHKIGSSALAYIGKPKQEEGVRRSIGQWKLSTSMQFEVYGIKVAKYRTQPAIRRGQSIAVLIFNLRLLIQSTEEL